MTLAETIASLNEWHFFKEFVYSKNTFRPTPQQEVELADNLLWIGDLVLAFQLKERNSSAAGNEEEEKKWFQKKVLGQATSQIRDTVRYLKENSTISLFNHRGHERQLSLGGIKQLQKLVVYKPSERLPEECLNKRFHESQTAGLIHIISASDYLGIVRTLLTPAELVDYLEFRSELIDMWKDRVASVPEPAIVGQYLHGDVSAEPSIAFLEFLNSLDHQAPEWDLSGIISNFPTRVTTGNAPTDYYPIVTELALLKRGELREFKKRFQLSIEKSRADEFTRPYRIAVPRTDCGFVFIPMTRELFQQRQIALFNFTQALKYEQRLTKCVGVAIGDHEPGGWFHVDWCYVSSPWEFDEEMEKLLAKSNPFREAKATEAPRYNLKI